MSQELVREKDVSTDTANSNAWCCTALWDSTTQKPILQPIITTSTTSTSTTGYHDDMDDDIRRRRDTLVVNGLDLTTAPDWMEWIASCEDRDSDEGGAGAYDTMRCDLIVFHKGEEATNGDRRHSCWGEDFHLDRLQQSYLSLLESPQRDQKVPTDQTLQMAREESKLLLQALIREAKNSCACMGLSAASLQQQQQHDNNPHQTWIQILKLTLLWSIPKTTRQQQQESSIVVRGHACSNGKLDSVFQPVQPIVVTGAILKQQNHDVDKDLLPTRFQNPQSKVASWCKQRKKMDNPETYKPPGVSEVLMLKQNNDDSLELLEGLSSNVFVVYKDGTLRTAHKGVLFGYVRHLVLQFADKCNLQVDTTSATLQDAVDGKWSEVFITSSSRLIYPISRILLLKKVDDGSGGFEEFWRDPRLTATNDEGALSPPLPKWQELLEEILRSAGYEK
ncbi:Aminotransferase class IV [Seminavis robusta]|uniref:Aminotransferase class IV n=1 Tax=Seminavis robusta TaxID=568900 RepID=A0A9N8DAW5_9STRA|nr:Aminotransferase class IV [Seminavis robusta]|eukprot:Sro69_g038640.1 Aminotransferase class IV (449) ;mRNA; r:86171-87517